MDEGLEGEGVVVLVEDVEGDHLAADEEDGTHQPPHAPDVQGCQPGQRKGLVLHVGHVFRIACLIVVVVNSPVDVFLFLGECLYTHAQPHYEGNESDPCRGGYQGDHAVVDGADGVEIGCEHAEAIHHEDHDGDVGEGEEQHDHVDLEDGPPEGHRAHNDPEDGGVGLEAHGEQVLVELEPALVEGGEGSGDKAEDAEGEEDQGSGAGDEVDDGAIDQEPHREDHHPNGPVDGGEVVGEVDEAEDDHCQGQGEHHEAHHSGVDVEVGVEAGLLLLLDFEEGLLQFPFGEVHVQSLLDGFEVSLELGVVGEEVEGEHDDDEEGDDEGFIVGHEFEGDFAVLDVLLQEGVAWPDGEQCGEGQGVQVGVQGPYLRPNELLQGVHNVHQQEHTPESQQAEVGFPLGGGVDGVQHHDLDMRGCTL